MKKLITDYQKEVEKKIKNKTFTKEDLDDFKVMVGYFEHERLIHLIVTVFVGLISILFLLFGIMLENITLLLLFYIALALFIPYILHYYFLENGVQKLYKQYELLRKEVTKK